MSLIIKAGTRSGTNRGAAFNFDDMARQANDYLDQVRRQAAQILAGAKSEADQIRASAEQNGRQAAMKAIEQMLDKKIGDSLLPALNKLMKQLDVARQAWLRQWEKNAIHVAVSIAGRMVRRKLAETPQITLDYVREALELAAGSPELQIRLNPADHETLSKQVQRLTEELNPLAPTQIIADPEISPGGCRVDTRFGSIDQQIEAQLARIEEELT